MSDVSPASTLVRLRLDVRYDGTAFAGWAAQPGQRTVQETVEAALATVLRLPVPARLTVAGRTDAGVHARGQVTHVDVPTESWLAVPGRSTKSPEEALVARLAGVLGSWPRGGDVVVHRVTVAPPGFDARFSAVWRRYAYRIADDVPARDPLRRHDVLWYGRGLDVAAMDLAAQWLRGEHDFAAYCKRREGATTIRTLEQLRWERTADGLVLATVRADAFCHSMVRALVGACLAVGEGRRPVSWPAEVLAARRRDPGVTVVAAHGLTLEEVAYPADDALAARAVQARNRRTLPDG